MSLWRNLVPEVSVSRRGALVQAACHRYTEHACAEIIQKYIFDNMKNPPNAQQALDGCLNISQIRAILACKPSAGRFRRPCKQAEKCPNQRLIRLRTHRNHFLGQPAERCSYL